MSHYITLYNNYTVTLTTRPGTPENTMVRRAQDIKLFAEEQGGEFQWVREYTKKNTAHIHGILSLPKLYSEEEIRVLLFKMNEREFVCSRYLRDIPEWDTFYNYMHKPQSKERYQVWTKKDRERCKQIAYEKSLEYLQETCDDLKKNYKKLRKHIKKVRDL